MPHQAVSRKLLLVFALQVAAISFAVICGVFIAGKFLEDSLIRGALEDEAKLFADRLARDPDSEPPHTVNLRGFVTGRTDARPPAELRGLEPGLHQVDLAGRDTLVMVRPFGNERIVLQFDRERVFELALYLALIPLALVLLVIYATTWLSYRLSRRTISPVVELARRLETMRPDRLDPSQFDPEHFDSPDHVVFDLADALRRQSERISEVLERERAFTRDASHELRTPLTVVQMASEVLIEEEEDPFRKRNLQRIRGAAREMQSMLEALLILARNDTGGLPFRRFDVNEVVATEVERCEFLMTNRPVEMRVYDEVQLFLNGVPSALSIIVSHLLRKVAAQAHSGEIAVRVGLGWVRIEAETRRDSDNLPRMVPQGGPGETIIDRLSRLFNWPVELEENGHIQATIRFPEHEAGAQPRSSTG